MAGPNEDVVKVVGDMADVADVDPIWGGADEDELDEDEVVGAEVNEVDGDDDNVDAADSIWQREVPTVGASCRGNFARELIAVW